MPKTSIRLRAGGKALKAALDYLPGNQDFPLLIGQCWNAVAIVDPLHRVIYINLGFTRIFGYDSSDILGRDICLVFGAHEEESSSAYRNSIKSQKSHDSEEIVYGKSGQRLWASITANPVLDASDNHLVTVCVFTDITDTKLREVLQNRTIDAMARDVSSAEILELICREVEDIIPEAVLAVNGLDENNCLYPLASPSLPESCRKTIRSLSRSDLYSPSWRAATSGKSVMVDDLTACPFTRARMRAFIDIGVKSCWANPILTATGRTLGTVTYYYFEKRRPDSFQEALAVALVNLCALALERRQIREDVRQLNFYDPLTSLPNRSLLLANGDRLLTDNRQPGRDVPVAVFCLNIDRFRQINASLGYDAGNELLRIIAHRLTEDRFPGDIVGRVGSDEFALIIPGCNEQEAAQTAIKLLATVSDPCRVEGVEITPTASIGISLHPDNAFGMEALLDLANAALAMAKNAGDNQYMFFSKEANTRARRSLSLEARLRTAVENEELSLLYQPQVSFENGLLHGVEALARWESKDFGFIPPDRFIHLAEEMGLINRISEWVVSAVCRQMGDWRKRGVPVPSAAINLSAPNFHSSDLPTRVRNSLEQNSLSPSDIVLELTESVFLEDNPVIMSALREIQEMGVRISLDDFGTGYSSLAYLKNIPITEIKLDKSFVRDLASDPTSRLLSQAIMRLGENLGLRVVVEGVETAEQFTLLKTQGFHILQGYYISHPLSREELERWMEENEQRVPPAV